ncbi:hypothetical protein Scep_021231 [Stephania cephalantha]|uniref:Uncharacterized protein n=1 Tax=Stephania cephalantha TaxID=152367 RepID=A0AAP0F8L5_9MAGN
MTFVSPSSLHHRLQLSLSYSSSTNFFIDLISLYSSVGSWLQLTNQARCVKVLIKPSYDEKSFIRTKNIVYKELHFLVQQSI